MCDCENNIWWSKYKACGEIPQQKRLPPMPKWTVYKGGLKPGILYGIKAHLFSWEKVKDFMRMSGFNEAIVQLAMASSVCWHGHVWRGDNHVLRRVLDINAECQMGN